MKPLTNFLKKIQSLLFQESKHKPGIPLVYHWSTTRWQAVKLATLWYNKNMKTDYIKPSVYKKIYQIMEYENALALRLSLETGMRIGDVLALTPSQLVGRTVRFTAQKTGKADKKVISADLAKRLRQVSGKKYIFPGRDRNKPRTRQAVWKNVKKASKILKLEENAGCHSARKTYAVELYHEEGLTSVQRELQHDKMETSMLYAFADLLTDNSDSKTNKADYEYLSELVAHKVYQKILPHLERIEQMFD